MAKIKYILRATPAGTPVSGETVTVTEIGVGTLATPSTNASGIATYEVDGSPGPISASATVGSRTVIRDGRSLDQMGTWFPNDAPKFWRAMGNGVIPGYTDPTIENEDMQVVPGSGLQVTVSEGVCLIDGHLYACSADTNLSIDANASGSTRYDRVVVRFTREGQTQEGACELAILKGTPDAGDAPALTKSDATFEFSLGRVTVIDSAASFVSGDITDERYSTALNQSYVFTNPGAFDDAATSYRAGDILYVNNSGKVTRLAKGTDGQVLRLSSGLPAWATQNIAVADIVDLTASAAELNTLDGITSTTAELNYTDGVTSGIQGQIDGKASLSGATFTGDITMSSGEEIILSGSTNFRLLHSAFWGTPAVISGDGLTIDGGAGQVYLTGADITVANDFFGANADFSSDVAIGTAASTGGKIRFPERTTKPTTTPGAGAGTGGSLGASIIRGGSDTAGVIRLVTGASGTTAGLVVSVTFASARSSNEYQVIPTGQSTDAQGFVFSVANIQTTGFDIRVGSALGTDDTVDIGYFVVDLV